jgi:aquaporin Z
LYNTRKKTTAEFFGTFWPVFGECGSAVLAVAFPEVGIRSARRLARVRTDRVLTMAYAVGHISGNHFNPAVTIEMIIAKRIPASDLLPYIASQVASVIAGAGVLYMIAISKDGFSLRAGFTANSYAGHSLTATHCSLLWPLS